MVAPDLPIDLPGLTLSGGASAAGTYTVGSAGATLAQVAAELGMPASLLDALNPSLGATATLASGTAVTLYSQTGWAQSSATLNTQAANGTDLTRFSGSAAAGPSFVYDLANSRELVSASGPNGDTMYIEDEGTLVGVLPAGWLANATTPPGLPGPVTFTGTNGQSVTYAPGSSGGQEIVNGNTVSGAVTVDPSATGPGVTVSDSAGSGDDHLRRRGLGHGRSGLLDGRLWLRHGDAGRGHCRGGLHRRAEPVRGVVHRLLANPGGDGRRRGPQRRQDDQGRGRHCFPVLRARHLQRQRGRAGQRAGGEPGQRHGGVKSNCIKMYICYTAFN